MLVLVHLLSGVTFVYNTAAMPKSFGIGSQGGNIIGITAKKCK